jgi:hypothetical protein
MSLAQAIHNKTRKHGRLVLQKCCKIITNLKSCGCHKFSKPNLYLKCEEINTPLPLVPRKVTKNQSVVRSTYTYSMRTFHTLKKGIYGSYNSCLKDTFYKTV